jgi:hypothetical protein
MHHFFIQKKSRAQATLPDILMATILFLLILVGIMTYAQNTQHAAQETVNRQSLDAVSSNIAEFIIKNPGIPSNWELLSDITQVTQFGLAQKDRVLDPQKVVAFINYTNFDYTATKTLLHIPAYEFYVEFSGGATLNAGQSPPGNRPVSVVQRLVTINGVETTFTLTVYEP